MTKLRQTTATYDVSAPKRATNLSVNVDLLEQARALNINLSRALEESLEARIREEKRRRWLMENKQAIEAYNKRVEEHGVFSDGMRSF